MIVLFWVLLIEIDYATAVVFYYPAEPEEFYTGCCNEVI